MPATDEVKNELVRVVAQHANERVSELVTILRLAGGLHTISGRIALEIELHTPEIVHRVRKSLAELYRARSEAKQLPTSVQRKQHSPEFVVRVLDGETLARQIGLLDQRRRPIRGLPNRIITGSPHELAASWRGAFLARGSLTSPGRSTSLEVACPSSETAMALVGAATRLDVSAKSREIRGQHKVAVRDSELIGVLLGAMGAVRAQAEWERRRQERETRGVANRLVNFDDANLRRSAQASVAACARVMRALEILGDDAPEHLRYAGRLRLEHREISLDELGAQADPPLTKDAIAGRIRRLLSLADKVATQRGIAGTGTHLVE